MLVAFQGSFDVTVSRRRARPAASIAELGFRENVRQSLRAVFKRLELTAIKRRSNVFAIATEILDRNLPRLRIEQEA
jgi:hypothetical protein